ncbi:hypothetical protein G9A89_000803 [Geosiphon pyriformis]|nr:hypothetical protein G9A89_000803 [Geosiphon pyriformis]
MSDSRAMTPLDAQTAASALRSIFPLTATQFAPSPMPESKTTIAYEDTGETEDKSLPVLLLVPGIGDFRQTYRFMAPKFNNDGYRIICMDLRGQGQSSTSFTSFTPEDVAVDMKSVLDHAQVNTKVAIFGSSLGGASVSIFASKYPDKTHSTVLLDAFLRDMPADKFMRPLTNILFIPPWGAFFWTMYWKSLFTAKDRIPMDHETIAKALKSNLQEKGRIYAVRSFLKATKNPTWAIIPEVTAPVLAIYGEKDPDFTNVKAEAEIVRPQFMKARLFQTDFLDGLGHYPQAEDPEKTYTIVKKFWAELQEEEKEEEKEEE